VVVTGANKGIGFEAVRRLAREEGVHTIMTARNKELGEAAMAKIREESPAASIHFLELDISNDESISSFAKRIESEFPHLDVLLNNAGIAFHTSSEVPLSEQAAETFKVNVYGTDKVTKSLLSFLAKSEKPRVINVCSQLGESEFNEVSDDVKEKLRQAETVDAVLAIAGQYVELTAQGTEALTAAGWHPRTYHTSKLVEIALTRAYAREHPGVVFASCCPGWCQTDMGTTAAPRTPEDGADTPVWISLEATPDQSGKFFADRIDKSFF